MNKKDMYYIYRITNNINHKTYIGQHKTSSILKDDGYMGSGLLINAAYKKYGIENFTKIIITAAPTRFEANVLEKYYIAKERKENKNGCYNIADGGYTFSELSHSKVSREKALDTRRKNGTLKHSEETKKKISEANKGKHLSEETKKKIGLGNKGNKRPDLAEYNRNHKHLGKKHSEEAKKKMSDVRKAYWAKRRGEL